MTSAAAAKPAAPRPKGRKSALIPTLIILGVVVALVVLASRLWTEVLWFDQLGTSQVLWTQWITRGVLFLIAFAVVFAAAFFSIRVGIAQRPVYEAAAKPRQAALEQYREQIEPLRKLLTWAVPAILGVMSGTMASGQWTTVQLFMNSQPFGTADPEFGMDIGFYIFQLPFLRALVSFLMSTTILAAAVGIVVHYLYESIGYDGKKMHVSSAARIHLGVLGTILMILVAVSFWLDRYSLLSKSGSRFDGANYTDVHALIPARTIMAGAALVVAAAFAVYAFRGLWKVPVVGLASLLVTALVVGGAYPAIVERFQVTPNAQELESEYIQRNINATKTAYGLDNIDVIQYDAITDASPGQLRADAETTASIRLLDPAIVSPAFRQLQQNKQYYDFADILNVDRYEIDGVMHDTVIGVRELNLTGLGPDQRTWVNDHTVYTHGFGVVAAYGNQNTVDGRPAFYQGGIPPVGLLGDFEPRIYFGQNSPTYSIVGAPEGSTPWELDYPDDAAGGQVNNTFDGDGGPSIGNFFNKLLFAIKFGDEEILFSERVNSHSQILYDRDPRVRVQKVAPFLTLDGRVYPAVVDGRVVWIADGYTTSNQYPYSALRSLDQVTLDSLSGSGPIALMAPQQVNYMTNAVKATVDAYDGSVKLYAWDQDDPILKAWEQIFPGLISPLSEISGDLMSHFRYPEDLFKVQRQLIQSYHVTDAREFYSGQDFWANSPDPTRPAGLQPPYYLTLKMPGQDEPTFSLISTFIPGGNTNRNVLTAFLAVNAEPGNQAGVIHEDYGKLRLLELARSATVPGPGQVQNNFNSDPTVSTQLNLLRQGNSMVINGNLLTLPVGQGLLYVQPVYVQSAAGTQYPLLQKVLVAFGDKIGFADTLTEALDQVFGGESGAEVPGEVVPGEPVDPTDPGEPPGTGGEVTIPADAQAKLEAALKDAYAAIQQGESALQSGDFAAYGVAQEKLKAAIERALDAQAEIDEATGAASTGTIVPDAPLEPEPGAEGTDGTDGTDGMGGVEPSPTG